MCRVMKLSNRLYELFSPFGGGPNCWKVVSRKGKTTLSTISTKENVVAKIEQSADKRICVRFQNVACASGRAHVDSKTYAGFRTIEDAKQFVYRHSLFGSVLKERGLVG